MVKAKSSRATPVKTPRELGYTFPAEWEKQSGTWFSWPRPEGISFPGRYHTIGGQLCELIRHVAQRQQVHINVPSENWSYIVAQQLEAAGVNLKRVTLHEIKTNEAWCRDHGPAFLVRRGSEKPNAGSRKPEAGSRVMSPAQGSKLTAQGSKPPAQGSRLKASGSPLAVVDWGFNAWGGKYPPYDDDDRVPSEVARVLGIKTVFHPGIVMEGGAVDFNGAGTVLTTTDCLLNKNRNPTLSREEIETYLKDYYGQQHVCWLTGGIEGDDTDGHIDDLARFINPTTIVFGVEAREGDVNYKVLKRVRRQIDALRDQDGNAFDVVELPMPKPVVIDGQRCPATYMNFLFVNGALLVPTFRDGKNDERALSILQAHLPEHDVVGVDCSQLIWGLGAVHCLSQQVPAA